MWGIALIKRILIILVLLLSVILLSASSLDDNNAAECATPTDLAESIIDDVSDELIEEPIIDPVEPEEQEIDIDALYPNHHIEIEIIQTAYTFGDEVILGFKLVDYPPGHIEYIEWQFSVDNIEWFPIDGENDETLKFIVTEDNYKLWYRVMVSFHFNI